MLLEKFDFVVVEAGNSGLIFAGRLDENPNFSVLLLEAGGDPPVESIISEIESHEYVRDV